MVEAVTLAAQETGAGPPVVILHGLFGSKRNWQSVARKLAGEFRVFSVDLRNHGDSPHRPDMNYASMAADIGLFLEQSNIRDAALIGHSMGGKAAMTYALHAPVAIRRLVIVDIAPRAYRNEYGEMLRAMNALDLATLKRRRDADEALATVIPAHEVRMFILQNLRFGDGAPKWRINLPAISDAIDDIVGAIPITRDARFERPMHVIRGEHSDRVGQADLAMLAPLFPRLGLSTITSAGHWPHSENPTEFLGELTTILSAP